MAISVASGTVRELDMLSRAGNDFDAFTLEAAAILRHAVPFDGFCVGMIDPSTNLLVRSVKFDLDGVGDRNFLYWEYAQEDVAHFQELATREVGVSVLEDETGGDKNRSGRFREVVSTEIGAEHELRGVTRVGGLMWGTYAMYRAAGAAGFNVAEADFMQRLEMTLAAGIRASTIVAVAADAMREGAPGPAVLVFDHTGVLVHATSTAAERLDDLGGALEHELPVPVTAIVAAVKGPGKIEPEKVGAGSVGPGSAGAGSVGPGSVGPGGLAPAQASAHVRARGLSGRWYSLHAAPFATSDPGRPQIAVTLEPATPPQILPLLVAAYGLTEREAAIVQAMLRGESTHAIGQSLFLSPYTVQDHFKSIFEKIGVSSRREVATRVFYGQYLDAPA